MKNLSSLAIVRAFTPSQEEPTVGIRDTEGKGGFSLPLQVLEAQAALSGRTSWGDRPVLYVCLPIRDPQSHVAG